MLSAKARQFLTLLADKKRLSHLKAAVTTDERSDNYGFPREQYAQILYLVQFRVGHGVEREFRLRKVQNAVFPVMDNRTWPQPGGCDDERSLQASMHLMQTTSPRRFLTNFPCNVGAEPRNWISNLIIECFSCLIQL